MTYKRWVAVDDPLGFDSFLLYLNMITVPAGAAGVPPAIVRTV